MKLDIHLDRQIVNGNSNCRWIKNNELMHYYSYENITLLVN